MPRILVLALALTIACHAPAAEPPKDFTNSIGMKFKLIPAGEFIMGSPADEEDISDDETQHRVCITEPYYLGVTEVTQGQWEEVMGTRPWEGRDWTKSGSEYAVSYVSWEDTVEFCGKLSEKEGREYRLPTEAEWEYACRAGSETRYCFGDNASDLGSYAWYDENASDVGERYAHAVGVKRANAWGLHDMYGNVWESCSDWYPSYYFEIESSPLENPTGPLTGSARVLRGGGWFDAPGGCRSAARHWWWPDGRGNNLGCRVVLVPAGIKATPVRRPSTAKPFHNKAQGRAAHPGLRLINRHRNPEGVLPGRRPVVKPLRGFRRRRLS